MRLSSEDARMCDPCQVNYVADLGLKALKLSDM
jgi:hypothetical protein